MCKKITLLGVLVALFCAIPTQAQTMARKATAGRVIATKKPDMKAVKAGDDREWKAMHVGEEHVWGFPHLFMESHPEFAEHFTEVMRHGRKKYAG
jgi:hypothetical protein